MSPVHAGRRISRSPIRRGPYSFFRLLPIKLVVGSQQARVRAILEAALDGSKWNVSSSAYIRQCGIEEPSIFLSEGLRMLLNGDDSAGYRFLAILLAASPSIYSELSDRWQWPREEAIALARRLLRVSPNFDERMSEVLPVKGKALAPFALTNELAERALDILDEISPGCKIVPKIRRLTAHPDRKISSKAALLVGKRSHDMPWAKEILHSEDPRLRANVIESFWGIRDPEAITLLRNYLSDPDNRVVGNAIIGLHQTGDVETVSLVSEIAGRSEPKMRMTAAWAMGRIGDSGFIAPLKLLAKDSDPDVRRAALRSLRQIRQRR